MKRVPRGELYSAASTVAWYFRAYRAYGENKARAIRALKGRCPGFSAVQYRNALDKALALYDAVQVLIHENGDRMWAAHDAGEPYHELFDAELKERFSGFRKSTFGLMVGMSFYWWHLR